MQGMTGEGRGAAPWKGAGVAPHGIGLATVVAECHAMLDFGPHLHGHFASPRRWRRRRLVALGVGAPASRER